MRQDRRRWPLRLFEKDFLTLNSPSSSLASNWTSELSALAVDALRVSGHLRMRVRGESMLPTLWPGDIVEIETCSIEDLRPSEIVLALRENRFFLHRLLARSQSNGFLLRGDSMPRPDPEFPNTALLGRLVCRKEDAELDCAEPAYLEPGYSESGYAAKENSLVARAQPLLPQSLWSRALGQLFCYCAPARSLALTLHARRRHRAAGVRDTRSAAKSSVMDGGAA